ncbi:3-hydroxyacyl-CoA dehydrogenase NAD-binding domain-containing protein [Mesorhizobium amorphae]|uniref:3-hydroxyacyl-CoA dehydrogenase NAD-binding domain-containing protein n=1 Tax=Mesorhizobium amorphae TaxID=71433 RepID=UPI0021B4AD7E|nr:3-hydroxyacyl-CoA dehydrogenase NAD-binding domain-containing protein [Mesorhizobium amorphae]
MKGISEMVQAGPFRSETIETVAVVGSGLIGGAWAAYFLSRGLKVRAHDPQPGAEARLRKTVDDALRDLSQLKPVASACADNLLFFDLIEDALNGCDYVQENAPEKLMLKQDLLAAIDAIAAPDVVIGSSTSSFIASELQLRCRHPERVLVAHPFNPPHLVPLVELVRGTATAQAAQDAAFAFMERIGKVPIKVAREAPGHVANRMTAALWREAVNIVAEGIASVADVDKAIRSGPGLRWAIDGPHMLYHLGGGEGGMAAYLKHLGPAQEARWASLGAPKLDAEICAALISGVEEEAAGQDIEELSARRDRLLIALLRTLEAAA